MFSNIFLKGPNFFPVAGTYPLLLSLVDRPEINLDSRAIIAFSLTSSAQLAAHCYPGFEVGPRYAVFLGKVQKIFSKISHFPSINVDRF